MTAAAATLRIPRVRWGIGVLLGAGVLVNYFDQINLSVGAPQLQQKFGLTDGELGWLFSGFFWSYALLQIPAGMASCWRSASSPTSPSWAGGSRSQIRRQRMCRGLEDRARLKFSNPRDRLFARPRTRVSD